MDVQSRLADALDTRVRIHAGRAPGRVVIHFAGEEDLGRILGQLAALAALAARPS